MKHREQILIYSRHTAGMVRVALRSNRPDDLLDAITQRLRRLWDYGCHACDATPADKETARRCVSAITKMFNYPNPCRAISLT